MKQMDKSKYDAGAQLKNDPFKEYFKDGSITCGANTQTAKKPGSGKLAMPMGN